MSWPSADKPAAAGRSSSNTPPQSPNRSSTLCGTGRSAAMRRLRCAKRSSKSPAQQGPKPRQRRQQCARSARCRAICRSDDALVAGASDLNFGSYLSVVGPSSRRRVEDGSECIGGCEAFKADARRADPMRHGPVPRTVLHLQDRRQVPFTRIAAPSFEPR
jgi:hypothetical protein